MPEGQFGKRAMPKFYAGQRRGHFISLVLGAGYLAIMLVAVSRGTRLRESSALRLVSQP